MSMPGNMDVGKIVELIMENPSLIEQISSLANQTKKDDGEKTEVEVEEKNATPDESKAVNAATYRAAPRGRGDRAKLLGALKPYVSADRAKAIDSMITIADILEMIREK